MLSQVAYTLYLPSLPACSKHQVQPEVKAKGSGLYTACVQPGYTHSPKYKQGLLDFQEYGCVFQSPLWTSHSLAFLCKLFVCLLFPLLFIASGSHDVIQLQLIIFDNYSLAGKGCSHWVPGQVKQASPICEVLHGTRSNNASFLRLGPRGSSNPLLPPPVAARLLIFTIIEGCWFLRLPENW